MQVGVVRGFKICDDIASNTIFRKSVIERGRQLLAEGNSCSLFDNPYK